MGRLKIYCFTSNYFFLLDKLPSNIFPVGLGSVKYPENWLDEKNGKNIYDLNKYFAEMTGIYWVFKNELEKFSENDWIGFCHYRRLWLNDLYYPTHNIKSNIYTKLLYEPSTPMKNFESILLQPTKLKNENIYDHFKNNHGEKLILSSFNFLEKEMSYQFKEYLKKREFSLCNMFITKPKFFFDYANFVFPFLNKLLDYCLKNNLCVGKNIKLPAYFLERFTSFWFHQYTKVGYLSYKELSKFQMSNITNKFFNSLKIPNSFNQCPTILDI